LTGIQFFSQHQQRRRLRQRPVLAAELALQFADALLVGPCLLALRLLEDRGGLLPREAGLPPGLDLLRV
jgi:hypothetical protein